MRIASGAIGVDEELVAEGFATDRARFEFCHIDVILGECTECVVKCAGGVVGSEHERKARRVRILAGFFCEDDESGQVGFFILDIGI